MIFERNLLEVVIAYKKLKKKFSNDKYTSFRRWGSTGAVFLKEPAVKNELKPRKTLAFLVV